MTERMTNHGQKVQQLSVWSIWKQFETMDCLQQTPCLTLLMPPFPDFHESQLPGKELDDLKDELDGFSFFNFGVQLKVFSLKGPSDSCQNETKINENYFYGQG